MSVQTHKSPSRKRLLTRLRGSTSKASRSTQDSSPTTAESAEGLGDDCYECVVHGPRLVNDGMLWRAALDLLRELNSYDHAWPHPNTPLYDAMTKLRAEVERK